MPSTDPSLYDALRASHALQRQLCSRLVRASAKKPETRQMLFDSLRIELAAHAAAEERFLYAPMLMNDLGLLPSRHALAEHHELDELVEQLGGLATDGTAWLDAAKALAHEVRHHLKEEETKFFQISGKLLSDSQKAVLAKRYQRDYERMRVKLAAG
jgi:hypothetical protein